MCVCSTNLGFSGGSANGIRPKHGIPLPGSRCTTRSIAKKSPTGSLPPAVPLAITRTFSPWTHTSDDSYIYQLSLVDQILSSSDYSYPYILLY